MEKPLRINYKKDKKYTISFKKGGRK